MITSDQPINNRGGPPRPWLVVIDQAVRDWPQLLAAAPVGAALLVLAPHRDGLTQIDAHLRRCQSHHYWGIAVVGEATAASLRLGDRALDLTSLDRQAERLQRWQQWLQPAAGLRLYGCQLAAGVAGRALLHRLAAITGLAAAASSRPVGPAALGGTTTLEICTAPVPAAPAWLERALGCRLSHVLGDVPNAAGVVSAIRNASDPTPISGQLQLEIDDLLNIAALLQDPIATTLPNDPSAVVLSSELGTLTLWADGRWSYTAAESLDWNARGENNDLVGSDYFAFASLKGTAMALRIDVLAGPNDAPTLSAISTIAGAREDSFKDITYADLAAATNEADVDSANLSFRIEAISSGTLQLWNATTSTWDAVVLGSTLISSAGQVRWQGAQDANGILHAFTVRAFDGALASSTPIQVFVDTAAVNDAPVATNTTTTSSATEDGAVITGQLTATDVDSSQASLSYARVGPAISGLTIHPNGSWSFDPSNAAYQSLAAGASQAITVNYSVSDGYASSTNSFTINVTGANEAPVATTTTTSSATEDGAVITGQLTATDVDSSQASLSYARIGPAISGLTIHPNGSWSFDPSDAAYQSLAAGASQAVTVNYSVSDGYASATNSFTINVTGTNDAPVISGISSGSVREAGAAGPGTAIATGQLSIIDVDRGDILNVPAGTNTSLGSYGTVTVTLTGSTGLWTYSLDNTLPATQALAEAESHTETFLLTVSDGKGGTASKTVTINVIGANDAPQATVTTTSSTTEDAASITGQLTATDGDSTSLTYAPLEPAIAGLTLNPDGSWSFDPSNAAYQSLAAGASQAITVNYAVSDGRASSSNAFTINITGANDDPVATYTTNSSATEDGAVISGQLTSTDADTGATTSYALLSPAIAGLTLNSDGSWVFDPSDDAYQSLTQDQQQPISVAYAVIDERGASSTNTFTITITGSADPITGSVIDGYIAGAVVFLDANGNRVRDLDEAWTTTNSQGTYSFDFGSLSGVLVAQGGSDVSTGLAFTGMLTAPLGAEVITPLTTLVVSMLESSPTGEPAPALAEAEAQVATALGLPADLAISGFDPFSILGGSTGGDTALALQVHKAAAQVANVMAVTKALGLAPQAVAQSLSAQIASAGGLNLSDPATLTALLNGNSALAAQLAYTNQQVAQADGLAGVIAAQITAQEDLVVSLQRVGQAVPWPTVLGNRRSNKLLGSAANDVFRGFAVDDSSLGRKQRDRLTGQAGDDLFQFGDHRGAFYDDGKRSKNGSQDYGWITDFSRGDQIQLCGTASDYLLREVTFKKQPMTAIYRNDGLGKGRNPTGWDKRDELIGVVQVADGGPLNLLDASQFFYVTPPVPNAGAP